ncbi:MAG: CHAD domain-containing protein, partial [Candidatus Binatia bacterium]
MATRRIAKGPSVTGDDPVGVVARAAILHHLAMLERGMAAARAGRVEGVHQLRVATRRLRAALALFESGLPRRASRSAREELAWLGRTTGPVRDLDVLAGAVAKRGRRLGAT